MLDHVGLIGLGLQADAHGCFRLIQAAELFQQAGALVDQQDTGLVRL